jgi:hypothetical protein
MRSALVTCYGLSKDRAYWPPTTLLVHEKELQTISNFGLFVVLESDAHALHKEKERLAARLKLLAVFCSDAFEHKLRLFDLVC